MNEKRVKLFKSQIQILKSQEKILLMLCSRSYGKSYSVAYFCILKLLSNCHRGMLINATYSQLRETVKYVLQHLEHLGIQYEINCKPSWCKSLLSDHKNIISINAGDGIHRYLKTISGDNPETVRGSSVDFIAIDEACLADEILFDTAYPCLRGHPEGPKHNYQVLLATTPTDVSNWIYKRFIEKSQKSFKCISAKAEENTIEFSPEKMETIKDSMTELMYNREYNLQWTSLTSNSMAYAFSETHIKEYPNYTSGRIFISCDINNTNLETSCGWLFQKDLYISEEIQIQTGGNPLKVAQEFHKRFSKFPQRQVSLFGDRYGSNNTTTAQKTYYEQLKEELRKLGWNNIDRTLVKNPSVWDSNEILQRLMEKNNFYISPSCKEIIRHIKTVQWKKNEFVMDKKLLDSGFYDNLRYIAWELFKPSCVIQRAQL